MADLSHNDVPSPNAPIAIIPLGYAGVKLEKARDKISNPEVLDTKARTHAPVIIEGKEYEVHNNYLVPHYTITERESSRRNEELAVDRARRFFYTAEPELDIRLNRNEIVHKIREYQECPVAELHRIKGRYLVGIMINRMERLAKAILQRNIDGIGIEIGENENQHALSDAQVESFRKEFNEYYLFLTMDHNYDPIRYVRMRDYATDHDGVLLDLVREMGKPLSVTGDNAESFVREGILQKIGHTMEAIDEAHGSLCKLLEDPKIQTAINQAFLAHYGPMFDARGQESTVTGFQRYQHALQEMTDLARARSGLKSEDAENFTTVRERITYLDTMLHEVNKQVEEIAIKKRSPEVNEAQKTLRGGIQLIRDMASSRLPRNRRAPEIYEAQANPSRDMSSCGRLAESVNKWVKKSSTQVG